MQNFQSQEIPHATEAMRMQDFQTQQNYMLKKKAAQPMRMQDFQTQENYMLKKVLPPFGEEDCSANENVGFPDTTKTTCYRSVTQC